MSDAMGRRPDGPGWYWYTGPGQWRARIDEPVWVSPPYVECRTRHRDEIVSDLPGDFTPLHPPVAAPTWSQEPPDAPGAWWVWFPGDDEPMYVMVAPMDGVMYCKSVISMIPRLLPTGVWWLPATVPQPPGEVGP